MWGSRSKSIRDNFDTPIRSTPSNPSFNHHSFKDVHNLFTDEDNLSISCNKFSDLNNSSQPSSSPNSSSASAAAGRRFSVFHRVHLANQFTRAFTNRSKTSPEKALSEFHNAAAAVKSEKSEPAITLPGSEKRVVVYMTSLRVVRPTFEACSTVQSILRGFRVSIDERDLSMDSSFLDELQTIMAQGGGDETEKTKLTLPRVFIGGRYVGGAEEVRKLHETGELKKFIEGLPAVAAGDCEVCGGVRFILCDECSGSHKCYAEKGGFRSCTACNVNGLVRCPSCLSR